MTDDGGWVRARTGGPRGWEQSRRSPLDCVRVVRRCVPRAGGGSVHRPRPAHRPGRLGQPALPLSIGVILASYSSASAVTSPPWEILLKNSSSTLVLSTVAQPGAAGVSFEFDADSTIAVANWSSPREETNFWFAGPRPAPPSISWYSSEKMIRISDLASSGCWLLAEIPMLEPPAKTGAGLPSLPGRTRTPNFASFHSRAGLPSASVTRSPIDQWAQPGAMIVAAASDVLAVTSPSAPFASSVSLM